MVESIWLFLVGVMLILGVSSWLLKGIPRERRARRLTHTIQVLVASSSTELVESEPTLQWVQERVDIWRLALSAACIGLAITREKQVQGTVDAVDRYLTAENPFLRKTVADFLSFMFEREERMAGDQIPANIAMWVLWNVKGSTQPPEYSEMLAAPKVGHYCIRIAAVWEDV